MPHLDAERLAALDHDPLTDDELAHLAGCAACRLERDAYQRLAALTAADRRDVLRADAPPLTEWAQLSAALRAEGLITRPSDGPDELDAHTSDLAGSTAATTGGTIVPFDASRTAPLGGPSSPARRGGGAGRVSAARWSAPLWRVAAAVTLFVGGAIAGRSTATPTLAVAPVVDDAGTVVDLASTSSARAGVAEYASVTDATQALERAQREYERASLWLASHDTTVNAQSVYRARLAALEQMLTASRAGLFEAPQDPVLNQYYLAAYTAREATLRQLGEALPVNRVMESF